MSDKSFKVKTGLQIPSVTSANILSTDIDGNISSTATLPLTSGGTGQTSANNALNALLPIQNGGTINYTIQSDGTNVSWAKLYNQLIQNGGVSVTPRRIINFVGATLSDDSGSDTTTITFTDNVGVSKSGGDTITASSASVIPLIAKGAASQSVDYFQIQNSGGTILAQLNASNQLNINYGSVYSQGGFRGGVNNHIGFAGLSGFAYSPAYLAIGARGAVNQTANLQEWQNSAGTVLNGVNAVGQIFTGTTSPILGGFAGNSTTAATGNGTTATLTTTGVHGLAIGDFITVAGITPSGYNGTFYITAVPTSTQISYANATTGAQTISGTVTFAPQVSITPRSARTAGLVIKGAVSQSNNIQEWQNSSGTVLASINNGGSLTLSNAGAHGIGGLSAGVMWYIASGSSGYRPLVVQAATSQTGDLTAWQNSSGTVVTKVNAAGNIGIGAGTTALSYGLDVFTGSARIWNGITGSGQTGTLYLGDGSLTKSYGAGWELYGALVTTGGYGISSNANLDAGGTTLGYGRLSVNTGATTTVGAVIRGVASQTADLQQWQSADGSAQLRMTDYGKLFSNYLQASYGILTGNATYAGGYNFISNPSFATTDTSLIVKAVTSQTGALQEWQNSSGAVLASINASGNLMVQDLTVNGTTTTINSTTLTVDDKNIELASVASPTDTTANGAGITIKGATDKTFNWIQSTAAFTSSEPISAPAFKSAGTAVSSNITLVSGYKYFVDTTSARTLTLPASPSLGDEIVIYDASNSALTNNITVLPNGNKVNGVIDSLIVDSNAAVAYLAYTGSAYGWVVN